MRLKLSMRSEVKSIDAHSRSQFVNSSGSFILPTNCWTDWAAPLYPSLFGCDFNYSKVKTKLTQKFRTLIIQNISWGTVSLEKKNFYLTKLKRTALQQIIIIICVADRTHFQNPTNFSLSAQLCNYNVAESTNMRPNFYNFILTFNVYVLPNSESELILRKTFPPTFHKASGSTHHCQNLPRQMLKSNSHNHRFIMNTNLTRTLIWNFAISQLIRTFKTQFYKVSYVARW